MPGASEMAKCWLAFSKSWFRKKSKGEEKLFLTVFFPTVCSEVSENVDQAVNLRKVLEHRSMPQICWSQN